MNGTLEISIMKLQQTLEETNVAIREFIDTWKELDKKLQDIKDKVKI